MIMRTVLFCWPAFFRNFFCFGMFLTNHVGLFAWNVFFMEWWRACSCSEISSQDWGRGGTGPNGSIVKVLPSLSWLVVRGSRVGDCETGQPLLLGLPKRKCWSWRTTAGVVRNRHVVLMLHHLPYPWGQQSK